MTDAYSTALLGEQQPRKNGMVKYVMGLCVVVFVYVAFMASSDFGDVAGRVGTVLIAPDPQTRPDNKMLGDDCANSGKSIDKPPIGSTCYDLGQQYTCELQNACQIKQLNGPDEVVVCQKLQGEGSWKNGGVLHSGVAAKWYCQPGGPPAWPTLVIKQGDSCGAIGAQYPCGVGASGTLTQEQGNPPATVTVCQLNPATGQWDAPGNLQADVYATYSCTFRVAQGDTCAAVGATKKVATCQYNQTAIVSMDTAATDHACTKTYSGDWAGKGLKGGEPAYFKCDGTPAPPGPAPTDESGATTIWGVFQMPNSPCIAGNSTFQACSAFAPADEVVCFGGASDYNQYGNQQCLPNAQPYKDGVAIAGGDAQKMWYTWGGGVLKTGNISKSNLDQLNMYIAGNTLNKDNYHGIMYDIELLNNVSYSDISASFKTAKGAGLSVMVTTSYTSPFNCDECANVCWEDGDPKKCGTWANGATKQVFLKILADENVDIFAPQFYGGHGIPDNAEGWDIGVVITGNLNPGDNTVCDFDDWQNNVATINTDAKIIPMIQLWGPDFDTTYNHQKAQWDQHCGKGGNLEHAQKFCDSGKFIVWSAN